MVHQLIQKLKQLDKKYPQLDAETSTIYSSGKVATSSLSVSGQVPGIKPTVQTYVA